MSGFNTNATTRIPSRQGMNVRELFQSSDLPTPSGAHSELENNLIYEVLGQLFQEVGIQFPNGSVNIMDGSKFIGPAIVYAGSSQTFFITVEGEGINFPFLRFLPVFSGSSNHKFMDLEGLPASVASLGFSFFFLNQCSSIDFDILGQGKRLTQVLIDRGIYQNFVTGFSWPDTKQVICTGTAYNGLTGTGSVHNILGDTSFARFTQNNFTITNASGSALRIDPAIPDFARIEVTGNILDNVGQTLFDISGLSGRETGTFTGASDASLSSTSITSVSAGTVNAGGNLARFNHGGALGGYLHQIVTVSGYTTNGGYNVTGRVVASTAAYFEILEVLFGSDESGGTFSADSTQLTDVGTALQDGDTMHVDTDLSVDYDGGTYVFNVGTDTVQINRPFTATQTGTWSTSGINHMDARVIALNNPGFAPSRYIASLLMSDNTDASSFSSTPGTLVLTGLAEGTVIERFKLLNAETAEMIYMGNEPIDTFINYQGVLIGDGAGQPYGIEYYKNTGAGWAQLPDVIPATTASIGNDAIGTFISIGVPVSLVKGDRLRPQGFSAATRSPVIQSFHVSITL